MPVRIYLLISSNLSYRQRRAHRQFVASFHPQPPVDYLTEEELLEEDINPDFGCALTLPNKDIMVGGRDPAGNCLILVPSTNEIDTVKHGVTGRHHSSN